ncbi:uncharacterized protein LACBIDRAFT_308491 [Laccaria bicolor S238N-H82]|uniref:Predicted protein n=1 Tax=Laccaria bicolor (strain S238N-H82 / ATCC MYA-4686) TaxID=486041 RepID=B0CWG0_LACBS|nr:uncharacterized protein LACBIDRAFT_308491 [Laccaria bicolor S238N-H82]EDR13062.1 predicted protein [Laccaria bicolor S238N-H82]|eukprot:XP_001875560.1 predicted protein [Laccaria bicolor S238N-H82]
MVKSWYLLFWKFKGGPDWIVEQELAEKALKSWRNNMIKEHEQYQDELKDINQMEVMPAPAPAPPPLGPMIREICINSGAAFTRLRCHLTNDVCYNLGVHPVTPVIHICEDETRFSDLLKGIPDYLDQFVQEEYYKPMAASCGVVQENIFEFNEDSNQKYLHSFVDVFRCCSVQVPKYLYLKYLEEGLLDQSHTIGQPHDLKDLEFFFEK